MRNTGSSWTGWGGPFTEFRVGEAVVALVEELSARSPVVVAVEGWLGDSGLVEAVKVLARGHQQLVWARWRQAKLVRSALRIIYRRRWPQWGSWRGRKGLPPPAAEYNEQPDVCPR